jgi:hypothetical protein
MDLRTDSEGRARLMHLPPGQVFVRLRKSGWVPALKELIQAQEWVGHTIEMKLTRAATIEGVCTTQGKPIHAFQIYFWKQRPADGGRRTFEFSEDGSFRIDEAAPGLVQLIASTDEVVQSQLASLVVEGGAVGKVSFDLPPPRRANGRVVDALTSAPVPQARVAVMLTAGGSSVQPWKAASPVDRDGGFTISGLGSIDGRLRITAEGYAQREITVWAGNSEDADAGRIALHHEASLLVSLRSSSPVTTSSLWVKLEGAARYEPPTPVGADGSVRIGKLAPGVANVTLESQGWSIGKQCQIRPGVQNVCTFDLDGGPLDVEVVPPDGVAIPQNATLDMQYIDDSGMAIDILTLVPASGIAHMEHVPAPQVALKLIEREGHYRASKSFDLTRLEKRSIRFVLGSATARVRMVGRDLRPLPGLALHLNETGAGFKSNEDAITDSKGEVELADIGDGSVRISAFSADFGNLPCTPLSAGEMHGDALQFVLSPGSEVDLALQDGATTVSGVEMELWDSCDMAMFGGRRLSDADGHVRLAHLAPGDYRVVVDHPGIWPAKQAISVTPSTTSFTVQLRRLGSAKIRVTSGAGTPLAGRAVELVDVASGTRVADWIAGGDVPAPAAGLATDETGRLVVHALPHGSYRCSVHGSSGDSIDRTFDVPPGAVGELEIRAP